MHAVKIWAHVSLDVACPEAIDWQSALSRPCWPGLCLRCGVTVRARGGGGGGAYAGSGCGDAHATIDEQAMATANVRYECSDMRRTGLVLDLHVHTTAADGDLHALRRGHEGHLHAVLVSHGDHA